MWLASAVELHALLAPAVYPMRVMRVREGESVRKKGRERDRLFACWPLEYLFLLSSLFIFWMVAYLCSFGSRGFSVYVHNGHNDIKIQFWKNGVLMSEESTTEPILELSKTRQTLEYKENCDC